MARVFIPEGAGRFTGGATELDMECANVRTLLDILERQYPGLGVYLDQRMAIAIDGEIHQDAWTASLATATEIYFIPRIGGGHR